MKVILCGYHWCGCKALDILISQGHEVFVYTHENPTHIPSLGDLCRNRRIPYSTEDISRSNLPFTPDVVCSIYYRYIIKKHVIDLCRERIFNLHPSLLPKYRGCSSLTWAMINGESETGFSYHYIDEGCDTGLILLQRAITIEDWDTQQSLYMRVMFEGISCFSEVLEMVVSGAKGIPQIGTPSRYSRECPHGGSIDPSWDMVKIERFIRAMNYPPYPPAKSGDMDVRSYDEYLRIINRQSEPGS